MENKLISILVPIYNVESFVERCVRSLFEQSYSNIEYIFVDDASPDNSVEVIKKVLEDYPDRKKSVMFAKHEINKGPSSARNTALDVSSGEYIFFIDSDDYLEKDAIKELYAAAIVSKSDIVLCDIKNIYADNIEVVEKIALPDTLREYLSMILMRRTYLCVWGKLYKRKLFENIRFIDGVTLGDDYAVLPRIVYSASSVEKVNLPLYNYLRYNMNSCTKRMSKKSIDDAYVVREKLIEFFSQIPDANEYTEILAKSMLYFKVHMIKACGSSMSLVKQIARKWGNEGNEYIRILPLKDRLVLILLSAEMWWLLSLYLRIGLSLMKVNRY